MRDRSTGWFIAAAVAIALAAGAVGGGHGAQQASVVQFAVAQHSDGLALSVAFAGLVVTVKV